MSRHFYPFHSAVHLLLLRDDNILLLLRKNTAWHDGDYGVVAGHLDGKETAVQGMVREAKEEAGITIRAEDLKFSSVCHRQSDTDKDCEYIDFFFTCTKWTGDITNVEPHKCGDLSFFPLNKLPENIVPYIREGIRQMRAQNPFFTYGWTP